MRRAWFQSSVQRDAAECTIQPADFGIRNGITQPIGLPQITLPEAASTSAARRRSLGRRRHNLSWSPTTSSCLCGRHSLKIGGEFRQFLNNNFRRAPGAFNFPSIAAFLAGTANSFSVTSATNRAA